MKPPAYQVRGKASIRPTRMAKTKEPAIALCLGTHSFMAFTDPDELEKLSKALSKAAKVLLQEQSKGKPVLFLPPGVSRKPHRITTPISLN